MFTYITKPFSMTRISVIQVIVYRDKVEKHIDFLRKIFLYQKITPREVVCAVLYKYMMYTEDTS